MSLSQKHSGKVLVPWFNIAEWKHVYKLLYSETNQDWAKALKILKIWKHRTPLLSAGVEGTLITLEALLVNTTQLSSFEISHIYSTSLVRFLNLCAANNDKQGTFYKTAKQNDLPRWLINIRHEIAHSHKVPSESMLCLSLKYCLEWLKEKYWDVQGENMIDFTIEQVDSTVVEDCIYIFQYLSDGRSLHENQHLRKCVMKIVKDVQKQEKKNNILESVTIALKEEIIRNKDYSCNKICKLLIEDLVILSVECEVSDKRQRKIPVEFLQKWGVLMNVLYETQIMPSFMLKLLNFISEEKNELKYKEVASLWIKEIFISLINKEKGYQDKASLVFTSSNNCMKMKEFANEVLKNVNSFSMNYLKEVLQYNDAPDQFIEDSVQLVSAFNTNIYPESSRIFNVDDLKFNVDTDDFNSKPLIKSRWKMIEDTTPFLNLPLGVLPHQSRFWNPLLEVE